MTSIKAQIDLAEALVMDRGLEFAAQIIEERGADVISYDRRTSVTRLAGLIRQHKQADKIRKEHPDA